MALVTSARLDAASPRSLSLSAWRAIDSQSDGTGRIDFVLVRCCGVLGTGADEREHCVNLHYTKNFFQFVPNPATALAATGLTEAAWKETWSLNVMNRWNGNDAQNVDRARLLHGRFQQRLQPAQG